jgi:NADH:ubiquinone oxidoreductase subunit F (NADH-binding)
VPYAIRLHQNGGPEVLSWDAVDLPAPAPGEATVRHHAVGLNFIDVYHRTGLYPVALPSGIGMEGAGVVEALGDGVTDLKVGDRVAYAGGPLGAYLPESQFDTVIDYEAFAAIDAMLGHGGIVVFDDTVDMAEQARFAMEFCAIESCGKCTPCRIGSRRGVEVIDRLRQGVDAQANRVLLDSLCDTMQHGSLCALGGLTPLPVKSALRHFSEDFHSTKVQL